MNYMQYLYDHEELLMYLRFHPKWYKILYYDENLFNEFLKTAKSDLKITLSDKLDKLNNGISYLKLFNGYLNKGESQ